MKFPITGHELGDWGLLVLVFILGMIFAIRLGHKWGWLLVVAAIYWAFQMFLVFNSRRGGGGIS
jgi:hypothetical protein